MSLSADGRSVSSVTSPTSTDMDGVEGLDLTALGSVDTFVLNDMSGDRLPPGQRRPLRPGRWRYGVGDVVNVNATDGDDQVRVVTEAGRVDVKGLATKVRLTGSETIDQLKINALDGNDTVKVDGAVFGLISPLVDLGAGQA